MESNADDTPIPMLQILGRNESSGTSQPYHYTTLGGADDKTGEGEADDEAEADADAAATSTMMLSRNATQSQINQHNHWDKELDRDGGDSDEEGSLAAAFDVQIQWCNSGEDDNKNNNKNDKLHLIGPKARKIDGRDISGKLHAGMQDGYYYKDGTQVEEATTYPKPRQDYPSQTTRRANLENHPGMMLTTPAPGYDSAIDQSLRRALVVGTCTTSFHLGVLMSLGLGLQGNTRDGSFTTRTGFLKKTLLHSPIGTPSVETSSPKKGKASLTWLSLGSMDLTWKNEEDEKQANKVHRKPFYSKVLKWSNNYAIQAKTGKGHMLEESNSLNLFTFMVLSAFMVLWRVRKAVSATDGQRLTHCIPPKLQQKCLAKYNRLLCKDNMSKFNYAYKFDYIYETLIPNVHYFSKKACSDLCMDELSWAYYGFGGPMVDYLKRKMFSRGGQTVILSDMDRDIFTKYAIPEIGKLWSSPPHLTADNFFNGDWMLDWMGGLGFGMIGSVAQNRLPKTVEDKYFHKENLAGLQRRADVSIAHSRAQELAILVLSTVLIRMVSSCARKSIGGGGGKGNGELDQIDSAILRSNIGYKSWKYHHTPMNHAKALTVLTSFDMYQELTDKLAEQMLAYNPSDKAYPVDMLLREVTQSSTKQRLAQSDQSCAYFFGGRIFELSLFGNYV
eukprot:jgi/Psemu1/48827/gm1.48827_g